ncbi:hypothetical protein K227x_08770 [Rubripirellula lacrimiformis]|uniref:Uncharacterized protein n=1 Tax=Rubripirellula lacrimiformis TaxID=1930273 RepID=A0A517N5T1_9BACT|nr:type III secretion system chaperone [Rubripirellula lacrimiformis]QDT02500.1 hypothetical protein K227x_08770 [Rubripirellula lacrimiformis]
MSLRITCLLMTSILSTVSVSAADDPLFSEIAMEAVFKKAGASVVEMATSDAVAGFDRVTGVGSLSQALESAGFDPQRKGQSVSVRVEKAGWKLPVLMDVDIQRDRIYCRMSLVTIDPDTVTDHASLLSLMAASNQAGDAHFAFDPDTKLIQLRTTFSNRGLTASKIQTRLTELAETALGQSDVWMALKPAKSKSTAAGDTKTAAESTEIAAADAKTSEDDLTPIIGRWSATVSADVSIAIDFVSGGTFQMVHVAGKQSAVSSGTVTRSGDRLVMAEKGATKMTFLIQSIETTSMELKIVDSDGKSGRLIRFQKSGS